MQVQIVKSLAVATLLLACVPGRAQPKDGPEPEPATPSAAKRLVTTQRFMVVAAHPLAARAGYDVLERGGGAVDAAIATELVLNLVETRHLTPEKLARIQRIIEEENRGND